MWSAVTGTRTRWTGRSRPGRGRGRRRRWRRRSRRRAGPPRRRAARRGGSRARPGGGVAPAPIRRPPPAFGEHNGYVLRELLGLSEDEIAELEAEGVTGSTPNWAV